MPRTPRPGPLSLDSLLPLLALGHCLNCYCPRYLASAPSPACSRAAPPRSRRPPTPRTPAPAIIRLEPRSVIGQHVFWSPVCSGCLRSDRQDPLRVLCRCACSSHSQSLSTRQPAADPDAFQFTRATRRSSTFSKASRRTSRSASSGCRRAKRCSSWAGTTRACPLPPRSRCHLAAVASNTR